MEAVEDLLIANANLQTALDETNEELQRYGEEIRRLRKTNCADLVYPPFGESFTMPTTEIDWQWIRDNCVIVRASTLKDFIAEKEQLRRIREALGE